MSKPTVHYSGVAVPHPKVGYSTFVFPLDHPKRSNQRMGQTSNVVKVGKDGQFETLNTIYVPKDPQ